MHTNTNLYIAICSKLGKHNLMLVSTQNRIYKLKAINIEYKTGWGSR